ncbi:MAG: DUF2157 domain-containing protein [Elusimicrobia bacterium]|nr:DUF2157 domain-containing protein [Elusimicrobiota bacterium]
MNENKEKKVVEDLEQESEIWVREGLISEEQRTKIIIHYDSTPQVPIQRQRLTTIIATLGSLLIGIGIILFFASNWDKISPFHKMILLLIALLGSYLVGYRLSIKDYPNISLAFYFLGSIIYGSNIFLVAQTYNIQSHWPNGILWWGIGVLPLALILSSRAITTLTLLVFSFWLGSELCFGINISDDKGIFLYGIAYGLWGCGLMGIGYLFERISQFEKISRVFQKIGLFLIFAGLYPFSFRSKYAKVQSGLLMETFDRNPFFLKLSIILTIISIFSVISVYLKKTGKKEISLSIWLLISVTLIWLVGFLLPPLTILTAILSNIILFIGIISIIFIGYLNRHAFCVNIGLLFFAALVIGRYFDFAWEYMERSAAFTVGGLLLLLMGFALERSRRKLLNWNLKK